jgi:hypothetical protein
MSCDDYFYQAMTGPHVVVADFHTQAWERNKFLLEIVGRDLHDIISQKFNFI